MKGTVFIWIFLTLLSDVVILGGLSAQIFLLLKSWVTSSMCGPALRPRESPAACFCFHAFMITCKEVFFKPHESEEKTLLKWKSWSSSREDVKVYVKVKKDARDSRIQQSWCLLTSAAGLSGSLAAYLQNYLSFLFI